MASHSELIWLQTDPGRVSLDEEHRSSEWQTFGVALSSPFVTIAQNVATHAPIDVNDGYIAIVDQQVMPCWIQMIESADLAFGNLK